MQCSAVNACWASPSTLSSAYAVAGLADFGLAHAQVSTCIGLGCIGQHHANAPCTSQPLVSCRICCLPAIAAACNSLVKHGFADLFSAQFVGMQNPMRHNTWQQVATDTLKVSHGGGMQRILVYCANHGAMQLMCAHVSPRLACEDAHTACLRHMHA